MSFRWYGPDDRISLADIRQIPGVTGIVSSLFDIPTGEIVPIGRIRALKEQIEDSGFTLEVLESITVHEDIKLGKPDRDRFIDNWCESLRNAGSAGIPVVCYNFMLAFDWIRTDLRMPLPDGSFAMSYSHQRLDELDLTRELVAWSTVYTPDTLRRMLEECRSIDEEKLWENLKYFIDRVVPVAEESGVQLGIHPDDPPWSIFGIPRIISSEAGLQRLLSLNDSPNHGLSLCSGSLGVNPENDVPRIIRRFHPRIHFMHIRNVKITGEKNYHECSHLARDGSLDIVDILKALKESGFNGPLRPDHGRDIWGEERIPGYGLYDRALGVMYINGIWDSLSSGSSNDR